MGPRRALGISIVWLPARLPNGWRAVLLLPVRLWGGERPASVFAMNVFAGSAAAGAVPQRKTGIVAPPSRRPLRSLPGDRQTDHPGDH